MFTAQQDLGGSHHFRQMVDELGRAFVMKHLAISARQLTVWLGPNSARSPGLRAGAVLGVSLGAKRGRL